ncbi:PilX N-terminal domain-containing pilus assembly protein [Ectopseudomonas oleovorans]|uniref:PilX N-terminal domain-containing pilus assembly protein n=1 Tax=Ectopseudomonas oleovorans TaxID=301 RepID=UPI0019CFCFFE|nr:PilX N-terminal domain-containing pilus assembly protein [Pseudomonas oleovorans]MBN7116432.1 pilus assembly protein PilX [Pseudomonas oleovorans]MBN7130749.1 pilus assembly protein PilX [Pseudomonas oleovorans]MBN7141122.1 pilus assembly protein PilX [Pseudomonas oleovorans]
MTVFPSHRQNGAVLLIALVMLLVLTLLAVSSMRSVTLETRITANRAQSVQLVNVAEAGLREAEFRFYGPGNLADKLNANPANCHPSNTLKVNGLNKPCLLGIVKEKLQAFVEEPHKIKADFLARGSSGSQIWMPYKGTDPANTTAPSGSHTAQWNSILAGESKTAAVNAEYSMALEGQGTYFYLNNAKATPKEGQSGGVTYVQSSHANIYLGLNN